MLKILRKGLLFYVLILVGIGHWLTTQRTTDWDRTLWVAVHPINGDGSKQSADYISSLERTDFKVIGEFFAAEAAEYGVSLKEPFHLTLGEIIRDQPPPPPRGGSILQVGWWSLKLRYWAWQVDRGPDPPPNDIDIFVRYFDPETTPNVEHSFGLQKGLIGVVNAFSRRRQAGSNKVIITHELLHTLGATDKYHPRTGEPIHPRGYAEPDVDPIFPQTLAELMGGRIPISPTESTIPDSLAEVTVGPVTATEIRWLQ